MVDLLFNLMGFAGLGLLLLGYAIINLGNLPSTDWRIHAPNLAGSLCVIVSLMHDFNLPMFVLEVCWSIISAYGIWRALRLTA